MSQPPLAGVTVLDLSRILAGPYCTMVLGDLGAEILKLESPSGDDCRHWGPPFVAGESSYFLAVNRNKKSLCIDLKAPEGREIARKLAVKADVLIENFRPGTLERLGLGYQTLRTTNPGLVFCSISGYGQTGPLRDHPGYDAVMQGEGGWMELTGAIDGPPMKVGASLADIFTGVMAGQGILAALYQRAATGEGCQIDVALYDSVMSTLCYQAQSYLVTGEIPRRLGNRHPALTPYETFETVDGYVIVGVGNDGLWKKFCRAVGREDLGDERFEANADRVERYEDLKMALVPLFQSRSTAQWVELLEESGIPVGRVRTVEEVFDNPQTEARNMCITVEHPSVGSLRLTGNPIKMSALTEANPLPPPRLGEHNEMVLKEKLDYSTEEVRALRERRVLGP